MSSGSGLPVCRSSRLAYPPVSRVELPLHPGEVDAPLFARTRTGATRRRFGEHLPWDRHLDRPALVAIVRAVERAAEIHRGAQPGDVPGVNRGAAVAVGLNQQEIPDGVQRVDFDLEIRVRIAVRIDEDFEVVVLEDDGVALLEGPPEVGFFQVRPEVEELVVPEHLDASGERRAPRAVDIDEGIGPRRRGPGTLREPSVDLQRRRSADSRPRGAARRAASRNPATARTGPGASSRRPRRTPPRPRQSQHGGHIIGAAGRTRQDRTSRLRGLGTGSHPGAIPALRRDAADFQASPDRRSR